MTPLESVAVTDSARKYPHVAETTDWNAQQSLRLLWDQVFALRDRLTAAEATLAALVAGHNTTETTAADALVKAQAALALTMQPGQPASSDTGGGGTDVDLPGGGDGGAGAIGCSAAGATGHDTGGLLNAIRAGQLICGTGNEFPALKNPTADQATRDANLVELLRRMIWHLQQGGFTAGRQQNPSGAISKDKLCVVVDGVTRAYDVFPGVDFSVALTTQMVEVAPPNLQSDAGIPD